MILLIVFFLSITPGKALDYVDALPYLLGASSSSRTVMRLDTQTELFGEGSFAATDTMSTRISQALTAVGGSDTTLYERIAGVADKIASGTATLSVRLTAASDLLQSSSDTISDRITSIEALLGSGIPSPYSDSLYLRVDYLAGQIKTGTSDVDTRIDDVKDNIGGSGTLRDRLGASTSALTPVSPYSADPNTATILGKLGMDAGVSINSGLQTLLNQLGDALTSSATYTGASLIGTNQAPRNYTLKEIVDSLKHATGGAVTINVTFS